uniref:Uncharacterized protein n=1 Tax=Lepeophtheirus salmonis TaxID=72036 RepID=A0A0K2UD74_LEPSM
MGMKRRRNNYYRVMQTYGCIRTQKRSKHERNDNICSISYDIIDHKKWERGNTWESKLVSPLEVQYIIYKS